MISAEVVMGAVNKNGSSYCFSCNTYFPPEQTNINEGDTMGIQTLVQTKPIIIENNAGTFSAIGDRCINEDTVKKYGVKVISDASGTIDNSSTHTMTTGSLLATKTRYVKNKQFSIKGSTSESGLFGQQLYNGGKYVTITENLRLMRYQSHQLLGFQSMQ